MDIGFRRCDGDWCRIGTACPYHPWIDRQGQSSFVWCVLGGLAQATRRLRIGTGVTCPTMRIHPAVIAQAAATAATMLPDRFFLGVGSGENLNEHILGEHWPEAMVRLEMLEEAVEIIRELWQGRPQAARGPTTRPRSTEKPAPTGGGKVARGEREAREKARQARKEYASSRR